MIFVGYYIGIKPTMFATPQLCVFFKMLCITVVLCMLCITVVLCCSLAHKKSTHPMHNLIKACAVVCAEKDANFNYSLGLAIIFLQWSMIVPNILCHVLLGNYTLHLSILLVNHAAYWPFQMWWLDFIGSIHPFSSNRHKFILHAIEYFTKWVEAIPLQCQTSKCVTQFIKKHIV